LQWPFVSILLLLACFRLRSTLTYTYLTYLLIYTHADYSGCSECDNPSTKSQCTSRRILMYNGSLLQAFMCHWNINWEKDGCHFTMQTSDA